MMAKGEAGWLGRPIPIHDVKEQESPARGWPVEWSKGSMNR